MDDHKIIDIAAIVSAAEFIFDKMIKIVQIHIAEELRCEVPDGQTLAFLGVKQTFCFRKMFPVVFASSHDAVFRRIIKDNEAEKAPDEFLVEADFVSKAVESALDFLVQQRAVYGHEIPADIQFQHKAIPLVIAGARPNEVIDAPDAVRCAFFRTAAVTIGYEQSFKKWTQVIVDEVMHDPVAKISGEDFAYDRVKRNEANTRAKPVCSVGYFSGECEKVLLVFYFKRQGIHTRTLVPASREVRGEQVCRNVGETSVVAHQLYCTGIV